MNYYYKSLKIKIGRGRGYMQSCSPWRNVGRLGREPSEAKKHGLTPTDVRPEVLFNNGVGVVTRLLQGCQGLLRFLCVLALQVQRQRLLQLGLGAAGFPGSLERHP